LDGLNRERQDAPSKLTDEEKARILEKIQNAKDLVEVTRLENQLRGEPMNVD
jgi:transposase